MLGLTLVYYAVLHISNIVPNYESTLTPIEDEDAEEFVYDEGTDINNVNVPHALDLEKVNESDMDILSDLTSESFAGVEVWLVYLFCLCI